MVVCANCIIDIILETVFGHVGYVITITVAGPIIEEFAKQISIKGGFAVEFTALFNSSEILLYTYQFGNLHGVKNIVITRLKVALMHLSTTIIQWISNNAEALGIENKEKASVIGNILGVLIHAYWNSSAIAGTLNI